VSSPDETPPNQTTPEEFARVQRLWKSEPSFERLSQIKQLQDYMLARRIEENGGKEPPRTVIVLDNGNIMYIEDGVKLENGRYVPNCREAVTTDPHDANFYFTPNCTGVIYDRNGMMKIKRLPALFK
jgi:hypothetical protein